MIKTSKIIVSAALAVFLLLGCSSVLFKSTPEPVFFQLDYGPVKAECRKGFSMGVKILEFGASRPYDQRSMIVVEGERVSHSSQYQWVASAGRLVADGLLKDLNAGHLFTQVAGPTGFVMASLELSGHVFTFSWEKSDSDYRAHLHLEVNLVDTSVKRKVILRKDYRLSSQPYRENSPDNFAKAMASVMAQFSKELQEDLCRRAEAHSSRSSS